MKPAIRRLKTRPEFLRVAAARRKRVVPGLILQVLRRGTTAHSPRGGPSSGGGAGVEDLNAIRVGFTASRKVGNAVARNRARRRLRAVVAEVLPVMGRAGHDYVLIARAATVARPYPALVEDLKQALAGLGE
ncbi:MAG: ribonuclease P protein component, partial [Kiloniellales bacterium]